MARSVFCTGFVYPQKETLTWQNVKDVREQEIARNATEVAEKACCQIATDVAAQVNARFVMAKAGCQ